MWYRHWAMTGVIITPPPSDFKPFGQTKYRGRLLETHKKMGDEKGRQLQHPCPDPYIDVGVEQPWRRYNMCLEKSSDQLKVYRGIDRKCAYSVTTAELFSKQRDCITDHEKPWPSLGF